MQSGACPCSWCTRARHPARTCSFCRGCSLLCALTLLTPRPSRRCSRKTQQVNRYSVLGTVCSRTVSRMNSSWKEWRSTGLPPPRQMPSQPCTVRVRTSKRIVCSRSTWGFGRSATRRSRPPQRRVSFLCPTYAAAANPMRTLRTTSAAICACRRCGTPSSARARRCSSSGCRSPSDSTARRARLFRPASRGCRTCRATCCCPFGGGRRRRRRVSWCRTTPSTSTTTLRNTTARATGSTTSSVSVCTSTTARCPAPTSASTTGTTPRQRWLCWAATSRWQSGKSEGTAGRRCRTLCAAVWLMGPAMTTLCRFWCVRCATS
eukprot:PhM_4_TR16886/c0_g1_i1/m.66073